MDFWRTVLVLLRRWYVTVPALMLSVGIAMAVYESVPTQYVSTSVLVLTTPTTGASTPNEPGKSNGLTNPLLNFDQGLSTSGSILIQALGTPEAAAELGAMPGSDTTFQITNGSTNPELLTSGPFVFIQGESRSAADAQAIVERVAQRARLELNNRQRELNAPPSTFITIAEVVPPTTPEARGHSRKRAAGAVAAIGLFASLAAAYSAESIADARRRRSAKSTSGPTPAGDRRPAQRPALQH